MKWLIAASALALSAGLLVAAPVVTASTASATASTTRISTGAAGWGYNDYNQANMIGDDVPSPVRQARGDMPADAVVTGIYASGGNTACQIADGAAYCWGEGAYGSIGIGSDQSQPLPRAVDATGVLAGKTIVDMAVSLRTSCALTQDGLIACWGWDHGGSLGNGGSTGSSDVPVLVDQSGALDGKTVVSIVASYQNFCALDSAGVAYCWGDGNGGLSGDGTNAGHNVPTPVNMAPLGAATFESLGDGYDSICGVSTAHEAYCWGKNDYGQIGDGNSGPGVKQMSPTKVVQNAALGADAVQISSASYYTCVTRSTGGAACWGGGSNGELGDGNATSSTVPVAVSDFAARAGRPITDIQTGDGSTCIIVADTDTYCWGYAGGGALGNGTYSPDTVAPGAPIQDARTGLNGAHLTSLASMDYAPCGVGDDGHAYCWGSNSSQGYLATGSTTTAPFATMAYGAFLAEGELFTQADAGTAFGCGVTNLQRMWCWGGNDYGQHGQGNTDSDLSASLISGMLDGKAIVQIAVGSYHVCALASDGTLACWGGGWTGALGDGSGTDSFAPIAPDLSTVLPAGRKIVSISAGDGSTCALDDAGAGYCWGSNGYGQLGVGDMNDKMLPTAVDTSGVLNGKVLTSLKIAYSMTCAVDTAGAGYCWGRDDAGSLGNGLSGDQDVPTAIDMSTMPPGATWSQIDPGETQGCGISSGLAYCWGNNGSWQLGTGDTTDHPMPYPVDATGALAGKTIVDLGIGYYTSCALDSEGVIYCWGEGSQGQNGSGDYSQRVSPTAISMLGTTVEGLKFSSIVASDVNYTVTAILAPSNALPSEPTSVQVAVRSNGRALVSWAEPADTGGSDISSYVVEYATSGTGPWSTPAGCSSVGAALSCTVSGLNVTRNYVFRVSAVNETGQGPAARVWLERTPSVSITGRRSDKAAKAIIVDGTSVGLTSKSVTIRVKLRGQSAYTSYPAGRVDLAGRFAWRGEAVRKAFVFAVIDGVRSDRITIT